MAKTTFPATYGAYRRLVNALDEAKVGVGLDDLPDVCLLDWYDDRVRPAAAAARAIRYAKEF